MWSSTPAREIARGLRNWKTREAERDAFALFVEALAIGTSAKVRGHLDLEGAGAAAAGFIP